ncbi:MAG TPA: protein kinase, partial [Byssovorax sp.]
MGEPANIRALLDQPEPERRIGPFRLVEQLGRGGFAPVWLAKEIYGAAELRAAAVKLFSLHDGRDAGAKRRQIFEEARALCQVEHPNVVRFFALPIDEARGVVGLAMEHVAGTPLDKRLAGARRLEVAEVLEVAASVASALGAVHRAGLVHRDVKPANVIDARGLYKLIDFGIAAADAPESDAVPAASTRAAATAGGEPRPADRTTAPLGGRWGTTGYVDPVCVVAANPATPASDLYALGALLYECITGRLPAATRGPAAPLSVDVLEGHAAPPRVIDVAPDALPALASVVDRLLSPKRDDRPQSAEWIATRVAQLEVELRGGKRRLPDESDGPFRGLGRFEERDRGVYFGRSSEIAAALHVLRERGLAAVVGPSGSGKSSLARAGVAPLVAEGALGWPAAWDVAIASPGADPRASITLALAPFVSLPDASIDDAAAAASIAADLAARAQTKSRGLLLLVDQLEELATVAADRGAAAAGRDRAPFATELLGRIAEAPLPGLRALVTVRRDMLDPVLALGPFAREVVRGSVLIEPIGDLAWAEVLEQALGAYGYTFEDDSVKADVLEQLAATTDAMPLVQFALSELWRQRDAGAKRVTRAGLERLGGVAGALDRHAEATLAALDAPAAEATRAVMEALDFVGILCVEFFVTRAGALLINELAPRPHNSGHLTFDACRTSQFEQQVRTVCGLPLGAADLLQPAAMANLLGDRWVHGTPNWAAALALPAVKLHLYGKATP